METARWNRFKFKEIFRYKSAYAIIMAELWPLLGVLFLGWSLWDIIVLYWCETVIIGFYNLFKILLAKLDPVPERFYNLAIFISVFGLFLLFELLLLQGLFAETSGLYNLNVETVFLPFDTIYLGIGLMFLSHGFSFLYNYLYRGEYLQAGGNNSPIFRPFGRIALLYVTILIAGFITQFFKTTDDRITGVYWIQSFL